jgi:putative glycosyltransferase (TIGR04348 family)
MVRRSSLVIVSPALASANNGNWQTAQRWRDMLSSRHAVRIVQHWPDAQAASDELMLALHARRSADSIGAWARSHGSRGLAVVLTGTDLYQDIHSDPQAQQSLALARRLIVLQDEGLPALPAQYRPKARVIYQSTSSREALPKTRRWLRAVVVGHLREVKSPQTVFAAARLLAARADILIDHIGEAEGSWAEQARATEAASPQYRWLGPFAHGQARRAIQRAHLLVHPSKMEGGAHVIMEAVCSGTPVLASRVSGNVGMLGEDYEGYFEHGDAQQLAALLARCRDGQVGRAIDPHEDLLDRLRRQSVLRAPLFTPKAEQQGLIRLIDDLQDASP